jgi:hypothetical protein
MGGLLVLIIIVVVAVVAYLVLTQRKKGAQAGAPADPLRRDARGIDPRALKTGDVVHFEGSDYLVRGSLHFDEEGFVWQEHLLDDASGRRWLSVEDDEELELVMWERLVAPELTPGAAQLAHDGATYQLDEHGHATYRAQGTTGTPATGQAEYYDYIDGARRLSFERYSGDTWEVSVGTVINERSLDIYPTNPQA